ncbi:nuclear transport factor 2 family protein [Nocardioides sp. TF02-7]|uniref:nuclear transport factor 2 family protein n=1 Tax=Nocardioides sp. TF02-7 TaxID=2917724 RepID=UPI001F061175|nr:nuclear transport factor 2 family protein [Nocardioides sp. TF02-7]UMG94393.1 nuclear transport factor 2 family protein [Nocardioides sp. TF02-7]
MPTASQSVETVQKFLETAFGQGRPQDAVDAYVGDHYIQHSPQVRDGKEGFIEMATEMAKSAGTFYPETKLVVANEQYVVMLTHFVMTDGSTPGRAFVDIMRLDDNGKIVEHWDVSEGIPPAEDFAHGNGMF